MLQSMTGFGSGRAVVGDEEISVELKSVNHKFCEVKARLPRELASLEATVLKIVKDRLARGAVDVAIRRSSVNASASVPTIDIALAREYRRALAEIAKATGIEDNPRVLDIASQPGVMRLEERGVDVEKAQAALMTALETALLAMQKMRKTEGEAIETDLKTRAAFVEKNAKEVAVLSPKMVDDYRARLDERIAELSRGVPLDPHRLAQEVAYFAERTDIAEEMTRLSSHFEQFRQLLASNEPAGRKLDFLVQEMHREVNTTGSKSQNADISARIVAMKAEVERIREQVQNVE